MLVTVEAQPERQQSRARQSAQHTHGHLFPQTPTTAQKLLPANPWTWSHAQSGFGYIHVPFQRHQFKRWINKSCSVQQMSGASDICQPNRPPDFKSFTAVQIDSYPEATARVNGNSLSPVAVSYLLWGREAAPHWPGWTSTSWHTPPPRPRHSRSRSTGREEGHKPRHKGAERGTERLLTSVNMWLRRRDSG